MSFDKEYSVYLTAEGYVLAVDGDVKASLSDVYYVVGVYSEKSMGDNVYYAQTVSLKDGTVQTLKLKNANALDKDTAINGFKTVNKLYTMDESSNKWTGTACGNTIGKYDVKTGTLHDDVTALPPWSAPTSMVTSIWMTPPTSSLWTAPALTWRSRPLPAR